MKIGYVRVSTADQNTTRQEIAMKELGAEKLYIDKCSGKDAKRPALAAMLEFVREGDTVIVSEISRLARSTRDLLDLVDKLRAKNVDIIIKKEAIDTQSPTGEFVLTVFAAMAQLEREYILARQREGIAAHKAAGGYTGRKRVDISPKDFAAVYSRWRAGEMTAVAAARLLGISTSTYYRRVREHEGDRKADDDAHHPR